MAARWREPTAPPLPSVELLIATLCKGKSRVGTRQRGVLEDHEHPQPPAGPG